MQLTVILALLTALLVGESVATWPVPYPGPARTLALTVGSIFLLWSFLHVVNRTLTRRLERVGWVDRRAARLAGRADWIGRLLVLGMYGALLTVGGWAWLVCVDWDLQRPGVVLLGEVLLFLPFAVLLLAHWWCHYPINRWLRECLVASHLAEGRPTRPVWTRRQYLSFQVRHGLLLLLAPLGLILAWRDAVGYAGSRWAWLGARPWIQELATGAAALLVFLLAPLLLRRIWLTRSLPVGPLRQLLDGFGRRIRLGWRDILVWDTHGSVSNAAVTGLWGRLRFVLLSDALIENMSDREIVAVFGHEAGHIHFRHIPFLVLFVVASGLVGAAGLEAAGRALQVTWGDTAFWQAYGSWVGQGLAVVLLVGWIVVFGWLSRRFERQADVYGAMMVGQELNATDETGDDTRLDAAGAAAMAMALDRIAHLNGIAVQARSWRHSSIISRTAFLRHLAEQDGALRGYLRLVRRIKAAIVLALLVGATGCWYLWQTAPAGGA